MKQSVKEFKQWWATAKHTLKCDEYDAMEIWLAARSKQQRKIDEVLDFAKEAHSDLNIGMLKMVHVLKGD